MRLTLALALALMAPAVANAQTGCAMIIDPTERLACFDSESGLPEPQWTGTIQRDPVTLNETRALGAFSAQEGCRGRPAILVFACVNDRPVMTLTTGCSMGDPLRTHPVMYRVGEGPLQSFTVQTSTDRTTLATIDGEPISTLLAQFATADAMHLRITPLNDPAMTFTFPTAGIASEAARIDIGCGVQDALAGTE